MVGLLVDWILQPVGLITFSLCVVMMLWLLFYKARPLPVFMAMLLVFGLFWSLAIPGLSNHIVWRIENWRSNPVACESLSASVPVVVLSGGLDKYVLSDDPYQVLSRDSLLRVLRAREVAGDSSKFYITGGVSHERQPAQMMASILRDQGIDADRIVIESDSESTAKSAVAMEALLSPELEPQIQLVTSFMHIPRAAKVFEKRGYEVCHVGTDTLYSPAVFPVSLLPYISGLRKSTHIIHELIAMVVYKIRGWI